MCRRTFCPDWDEEMIHRDHRKHYESASGLGQIISREAPRTLTTGDVDQYVRKWLGDMTLLRLIEHKQPDQELKAQQQRALTDLDRIVRHATGDPNLHLDPRSGVYIMRGEIGAATSARREAQFEGKQVLYDVRGNVIFEPRDRRQLWDWLDGKEISLAAINRIRPAKQEAP